VKEEVDVKVGVVRTGRVGLVAADVITWFGHEVDRRGTDPQKVHRLVPSMSSILAATARSLRPKASRP
jgi:UDP-glucose 6-dehydrogenase